MLAFLSGAAKECRALLRKWFPADDLHSLKNPPTGARAPGSSRRATRCKCRIQLTF